MKATGDCKRVLRLLFLCAAMSSILVAQTFTNLASVDNPWYATLVQGLDGNFYSTTRVGESVFKITPAGVVTNVYTFCRSHECLDGRDPYSGVILATDENFYGTTYLGGWGHCRIGAQNTGCGTVFRITPDGSLLTLFSFAHPFGVHPWGGLVEGPDGYVYGTTEFGGAHGMGSVFKIIAPGYLYVLHDFCDEVGCAVAPIGALTFATDGNFYGTASAGGANSGGQVFAMNLSGQMKPLYNFDVYSPENGFSPMAGVIQASDGSFYGTTSAGGDMSCNAPNGCGTIFEMKPGGALTTLHAFEEQDGFESDAALFQATDGNFYGTSKYGGDLSCYPPLGCGTVFQITPDGVYTVLHVFEDFDGIGPQSSLMQGTDGKLYGTTQDTVFSIDMGLNPNVAFVRPFGGVAQNVEILGQGFRSATNVSFHGHRAHFSVDSDTSLTANLPKGATTGFATVTVSTGVLSSNVPFRVLPQLLSFNPPSGPPGTQVTITGVSLTQTLGVGFGDRVQSQFTVNSDTSVTATVPKGAKTGKIGIETKGGVAISSGTFEVTE